MATDQLKKSHRRALDDMAVMLDSIHRVPPMNRIMTRDQFIKEIVQAFDKLGVSGGSDCADCADCAD